MPELGSVGHSSMLIRRFCLFSQTFLFFIAAELLRTVEILVGGAVVLCIATLFSILGHYFYVPY